jgi:hypothetical protein
MKNRCGGITVLGREIGWADKIHVLGTPAKSRVRVTRKDVERAEAEIKRMQRAGEVSPVTIITTHHYANGVYGREVFLPAGTLATGGVHKDDHLNVLSQGEIRVLTAEGMKQLKAPATFASKAGMKRIGVALTDVVWTTFHPNPENETDFFKLEAAAIEQPRKINPRKSCPPSQLL